MSKTRGIFIDMDTDIARYGLDAFRYYLLREFSFGNDGDYRPNRLHARYNADLANDLGNLLNRTLGLVSKNFDAIPEPTTSDSLDNEVIQMAQETVSKVDTLMNQLRFRHGVRGDLGVCSTRKSLHSSDTGLDACEIGRKRKGRMGTILYNSMEALRVIAVLISPFMPATASRIYAAKSDLNDSSESSGVGHDYMAWGGLQSGRGYWQTRAEFSHGWRFEKAVKTPDKASAAQAPQAEEISLNLN